MNERVPVLNELHSGGERHTAALGTDKSYKKNKITWEKPAFEALKESVVSSVKCCQKVKHGEGCSDVSTRRIPNGKMAGDLDSGERMNGKWDSGDSVISL